MDEKSWPSLNESINEELKPESAASASNMKGGSVGHEVLKVANSSEAACIVVFSFFVFNETPVFQVYFLLISCMFPFSIYRFLTYYTVSSL